MPYSDFTLQDLNPHASIILNGDRNVPTMSPSERRHCLGYAARGLVLERGQLRRAIRYRSPGADDAQLASAIKRTGLGPTIARPPEGDLSVLQRGGQPLSTLERAKVHLARATSGTRRCCC